MIDKYHQIQNQITQLEPAREVVLVAISKNASVPQIAELYQAGCRHFGESRVQVALEKMQELPLDIRWHFIGPLQTNKINKILGKFFLIHSVDSIALVEALSEKSKMANIETSILLQVNVSREKSKQGFSLEACYDHFPYLASLPAIKILGLMTMAPHLSTDEVLHSLFKDLFLLREKLRLHSGDMDILPYLSMGMSQDYKIALSEGSNIIRIGSSIFG